MVILSVVLNSYWMWLMIKMIVRVIKRAMQPKTEDEDNEKIELVKADSLAENNDNEADCGSSSTQGSNLGEIAEEAQNDD